MFGKTRKNSEEHKPSKRSPLQLDDEERICLEDEFAELFYLFNNEEFFDRKVYAPTKEDFPFRFDGDKNEVKEVAARVAGIMEINPDDIQLVYFSAGMENFAYDEEEINAGGEYLAKDENGKYLVALREDILKDPEALVATLAHEFAHIKLLGEFNLPFNDEYLTDIVPMFYGLGLFPANTCYKFYGSSYSSLGYLTQMEWGYLLAMYAFSREERQPAWVEYLDKTVRKDFEQSLSFIIHHRDETVFGLDDEQG